mmetsp:Transcript_35647/g.112024  ORF Transcript_35647/g.112024 Transcript_35647/m.112024 type:complete len:481 (-) Transcript_35647:268-1710(-)
MAKHVRCGVTVHGGTVSEKHPIATAAPVQRHAPEARNGAPELFVLPRAEALAALVQVPHRHLAGRVMLHHEARREGVAHHHRSEAVRLGGMSRRPDGRYAHATGVHDKHFASETEDIVIKMASDPLLPRAVVVYEHLRGVRGEEALGLVPQASEGAHLVFDARVHRPLHPRGEELVLGHGGEVLEVRVGPHVLVGAPQEGARPRLRGEAVQRDDEDVLVVEVLPVDIGVRCHGAAERLCEDVSGQALQRAPLRNLEATRAEARKLLEHLLEGREDLRAEHVVRTEGAKVLHFRLPNAVLPRNVSLMDRQGPRAKGTRDLHGLEHLPLQGHLQHAIGPVQRGLAVLQRRGDLKGRGKALEGGAVSVRELEAPSLLQVDGVARRGRDLLTLVAKHRLLDAVEHGGHAWMHDLRDEAAVGLRQRRLIPGRRDTLARVHHVLRCGAHEDANVHGSFLRHLHHVHFLEPLAVVLFGGRVVDHHRQ